MNDLQTVKPCPLCGEPVFVYKLESFDRTIKYIKIQHGPSTDCGISFLEDEKTGIEKWNKRFNRSLNQDLK